MVSRRPAPRPKVRPGQVLVAAVVLAIFLTATLLGGGIGALLIAALSIGAGALLIAHWRALDPRVRVFRAVVVLVGLAVAVSLAVR